MKLKFLLFAIFCSPFIVSAQFTVKDGAGNIINDGDIVEYGTTSFPESSLEFYVTNDSSEEIYTRIEFVDAINSNNNIFGELCYGLCYNDIAVGSTVPPNPSGVVSILPGESTPPNDHFWGGDEGNGSDNVDFIFTFHQYEADGVTETGTSLTFTYRYNPTLGVNENENTLGLQLGSTVLDNTLSLESKDALHLNMYDLQGRLVQSREIEAGSTELNVANLSTQMYIFRFTNDAGVSQSIKVVKK